MSNNPLDSLYKFCSCDTAQVILNERTLRWSAPERFGDPFEIQSKPDLGFSPDSLLDSTIKLTSSMIFAPEQPKGDSPLINAVRRWRDESRFATNEEAYPVLKELLGKMVDNRLAQLESALSKWSSYARNIRVCCFTGKVDNLVAWEKFAKNHQGVAFKFAVGEGSSLQNPKAIQYQTERQEFTVLREQLGAIMQNRKDHIVDRFDENYLAKSRHQKPEDEWRIVGKSKLDISIDNNSPDTWFDDVSFNSQDLKALYFGLSTPEDKKKALLRAIKETAPKAKVFQAVKAKHGYAIEFERYER